MGLEVLKWIRQQPGMCLMVVVLTASAQEGDIATAYRLGANAFLTKPSEASKLDEMATAIKAFWLTQNTLPLNPRGHVPAHLRPVGLAPPSVLLAQSAHNAY